MNTVDLSKDFTFIVLFLIIIIFTIALRVLITRKGNSFLNKPLSILAVYLTAICLFLCLLSTKLGIYKIVTSGDPKSVVSDFYDSVLSENYNEAYSLLNNCQTLGLETVSSNNSLANDKLSNALEKSYSYSISENIVISGLNARQKVDFTYLDLNAVEKNIASNIDSILAVKIETLSHNDLYTDDGHYQKSLMDSIYDEATDIALKNVTDYYTTISYDVTLEYTNGQWFLNVNDDMIRGFTGGK